MVGQQISHYTVVEKIGEGGMGVVYKAQDSRLDRTVALKFLAAHLLDDAEAKTRFLREAKAAAGLDHPNVCTVHEIGEADGKTFLSMAFIEGQSLEARIGDGPLPLGEVLDVGRQVAAGLQAAHEKGIIHRDIKPANILIDSKGRAVIMDFGLARLTEASRLTKPETTLGTVAYMSPEQLQGAGTDHRSDIWSLGVVLYEMVTGLRPFKGEYDQALGYEIVNEQPEPLTGVRVGVPMELEFLTAKCLEKDANKRYGSAAELAVDLTSAADRLKSGQTRSINVSRVAPEPIQPTPAPAPKRRPWLLGALAAVMSVAFVVLAAVHFNAPPPEHPVRRFSFTPESLFQESQPSRAAISPDGHYIVYASGGSPAALWVRPIDDEQPQRIEGTEGARLGMFWSPDSRYIGFAAGGNLRKIAIAGGPAVTVCPLPGSLFAGGSWSPDGETIVFSSGSAPPALYEVPTQGGEPRLLFDRVDGEKGPGNHRPHFLPAKAAARSLLLTIGNRIAADIYLKNLETGALVKLAEGVRSIFSPSGHVVYQTAMERGGLWALPFSLETLEVTGAAFSVATGVGDPSIGTDGTLVTVSLSGAQGSRRLVWRDRKGIKLGEIGQPQPGIDSPALSPDGRRVAVTGTDDESGQRDIWLHQVDRAIKQRLTFHAVEDNYPSWSPDGERIMFLSTRGGSEDLFERTADGSGEAGNLLGSPAREMFADWSPDGRTLIYNVIAAETGYDLWLLIPGADGEPAVPKPFLATPFAEHSPQISPDGRFVAYVTHESGNDQVLVREFPGGGGRWQVSTAGGVQPRWSHDGKELFYAEGNSLMAVAVSSSPTFSVGKAQRLFDDSNLGIGAWDYDVSSDGRFVMVEDIVEEGEGRRKPAIHVTENWYEEFRDRDE